MSSRKVLFCSPTASVYGGVQTWLDHICEALREDGWHPIVGLVKGIQSHRPEKYISAHPQLETVEIDGRGLSQKSRVRAVMRCINSIKPDVFVPLTVVDAHEAICQHKLTGNSTRYLLTVHGNVPAQIAETSLYREFVDLAVCPGNLTCRLLKHVGIPEDRIRHIPNGANIPLRVKRSRKPGTSLRLGFVGRMTRHDKRVMDLVPFLKSLVNRNIDFVLDIVGDGPSRKDLEDALSSYVETGRVRFLGQRTESYLYEEVYPQLDCFVLFSSSEAFGIAAVEAMMHGVVPVTARFVGHGAEKIIIHKETGLLFDVGDMATAAENVALLDNDNLLWERLSKAARAHVKSRYTWANSKANWLKAFVDIVELPCNVGRELNIPDDTYSSGLERIGLSENFVDLVRRLRLRLFGVPESMAGGIEWPWIRRFSEDELASISRLAKQLDKAQHS